MSKAMKSIVGNYVRLGDAKALNDMKAHRAKLLINLKLGGNALTEHYSISNDLEDEIAIIDDGLASLDPKPTAEDG
jgi:hypothetical protein